jgi:hypothetical protein
VRNKLPGLILIYNFYRKIRMDYMLWSFRAIIFVLIEKEIGILVLHCILRNFVNVMKN